MIMNNTEHLLLKDLSGRLPYEVMNKTWKL